MPVIESWTSPVTAVGGRRFVMALGVVFVGLSVGFPLLPTVGAASIELRIVLGVLAGGPGLALVSGGYRLPRSDIRPEFYVTVGRWCLRGIAVGMVILIPLILASSDSALVPNAILLTALGSLAGFAAGTFDAQAKTRRLELQETIDQLKTSNERLEDFAYAASHDLQEPLRMISSYLTLLERQYRDDLDADAQEYIDFAVDGADRMREMVDSLLEYSRVETQGNPFEPVDLDDVLADVRTDLQVRIEETNADIDAESLPRVHGDPSQLRELFQNLVTNALEYSGDDPPQIRIAAERDGDTWTIIVHDEGIGIDPEHADQIFDVFTSLHRSTEYSGTGIGLALCERIVERHDGHIWVDSQPGAGATFYVTLPAADAPTE